MIKLNLLKNGLREEKKILKTYEKKLKAVKK